LMVLALAACVLTGSAPALAKEPDAVPASTGTSGADLVVERAVANANASIMRAIAQAQHLAEATPQDADAIIERLLAKVDRIVERTLHIIDAEVEFEYIEVQIGDQTVLVDPLKVAGS